MKMEEKARKEKQKQKDRERVRNILKRNFESLKMAQEENLMNSFNNKPDITDSVEKQFRTPLRSSGIHFKVENAWKNNMTFDGKSRQLEISRSNDKLSNPHTNSSRSLRNSYERRSHSPLEKMKELREYAKTLKFQISEKEKLKCEEKQMSKLAYSH